MSDFTQDFFTSRRNYNDGNTRVGEKDRLWYDSITNTIRIGDGTTPGGILVGGSGGGSASVTVSMTEPTGASEGDLWYHPSNGLFIRYNGAWSSVGGAGGGAVLVRSAITSVQAGWTIDVEQDYTDPDYVGGIFTLVQNAPTALSLSNPIWIDTGSNIKNGYTDFSAGLIDYSDARITLTVSQGTFNTQSSDFITIGTTTITGADIIQLMLGIDGTAGGNVPISAGFLTDTEFTQTSAISCRLTTTAGQKTASGVQLVVRAPILFNITNAGVFPAASVPYFDLEQAFNWSVSATGTISSGTTALSGSATQTLTTSGATSGNSVTTYDSTAGTYTLTSNYSGTGFFGSGSRSVTATSTIGLRSIYYPLFWKITASNANPNFTTSDNYLTQNFALGQGANTSANTGDFLWIAIPTRIYNGVPAFKFDQPGFPGIVSSIDQSYLGQDIGGETYNVFGFTNYNTVVYLYTGA